MSGWHSTMRFDRLTLMKAALVLVPVALLCASLNGRKFYDDDPLWREPRPLRVEKIQHHELSNSFDFFQNTFAEPGEKQSIREPIRAEAANTLGEVPDSAWSAPKSWVFIENLDLPGASYSHYIDSDILAMFGTRTVGRLSPGNAP